MDYDQSGIATTYDEARALTSARRRHWQRLLSAHVDRTAISLVVDLGCGTGRFSELLASELGARVIGLDPSEKMIDQARLKPATSPVVFGRASAHELPLPDGCVDLVFMSQIYHHLPNPAAVARECWRVLRTGGYICIRTGTRENDVVVPNFFPWARAMLDADLPSSDEIRSNFASAGFMPRHHEIVTEVVAPDWPSFVRKSALRADSFLARLSDTEFDQGMAALRAHRANINPAEAVTEEIDWFRVHQTCVAGSKGSRAFGPQLRGILVQTTHAIPAAEPSPDAVQPRAGAIRVDQLLHLRMQVFGQHELALVVLPPGGEDCEFMLTP